MLLRLLVVYAFLLAVPAVAQTARHACQPALPNGLALDARGNLYVSDIGAHCIFRVTPTGQLTVVAGTGAAGFSGDGGLAAQAQLSAPHDLAFDAAGNLLIADTGNSRIRRIDRRGRMTTIAGNGKADYAGDGGAALLASLNNPQSLAFDLQGNLLIADTYNHVIRRVNQQGVIATLAGSVPGFGGDGGLATQAQINLTMAVAVASDGSVFISDAANSRIRQITPDGKIKTVAGYGPAQDTYGGGYAGDGGAADKAKLFSVTDLKFDARGGLWIVDSGNHRVRLLRDGIVATAAGTGQPGHAGEGKTALALALNTPQKVTVARDGSFYIADRANGRVLKVDARGGVTTVLQRQ